MVYHYDLDLGSLDLSNFSYNLQNLWNAIERFMESPSFGGFIAAFGFFAFLFSMAFSAVGLLRIVANWILYDKAKQPGWAAIIPFFNEYTLYKMTWGSGWYFLLLLIPVVNFVIHIITQVKLAKVFGKGGGWACGLIFLNTIFLCITSFDKSIRYVGPYAGDYETGFAGGQNDSYYKNTYYNGESAQPSAEKKYCPECGAELHPGDKFCMSCGKQI